MSVPARGSRPASSRGPGSADPRRSMRASTEHLRVVGGSSRRRRRSQRSPSPGSQRRPRAPAPGGAPRPYAAGMGELIPLFPLGTPLFPGVVLPLQIFEPRYRRLMRDLMALPEAATAGSSGWSPSGRAGRSSRSRPPRRSTTSAAPPGCRSSRPQPDGGFRIVTVGGDRFRLLDVVVGERPALPAGRGRVARRGGGRRGGRRRLRRRSSRPADRRAAGTGGRRWTRSSAVGGPRLDGRCWPAACAALFTRYVAEVAGLRRRPGRGEERPGAPADDADGGETPRPPCCCAAVADDPTALSYLVASAALLTTEDRQALLAESATRRRLAAESRLLRRELTLLHDAGRRARAAAASSPPR